MEKPPIGKDMDKCAIIYRKDALSFIYICYHCGTSFTNIDSTLQHIESHFELVQVTIDEKNVKSECNDDFDTDNIRDKTDPEIEIKVEPMEIEENCDGDLLEKPSTFDCERCDSVFSSKFSFRSHTLRDHFKEQALECAKCGKKFKRDASFKIHLRQHIERGEVDWNCEGYGIREPSKIAVKCPEQQENSGPAIQVEMVKSEKRQPKKRKKTTEVSTYECQRCDSVFSSKFSFRSHTLRDHFKEQALECGKCEKRFKRDASFKNHLRQHIERGEVDWDCEGDGIPERSSIAVECPEQQVEMVEIQSEKREPKKKNKTTQVKSKQKTRQLSSYICHKCSETYGTSDDLNVHLNAHSTDDMQQTNKCKECKTYFRSAFDLRLHVLEIHLSIKKFKCSSCLVEFKKEEKSLLEKHLEFHLANNSTNWTNICHGICNRGNDATRFEEITTTTESSCELCGEKFYLKSNLDEHTRCMHSENEQKYRCAECETVFTKLKFYFAHQLEHRRVGATHTETDMNVLITNLNSYIEEQFVWNEEENASNPYKCLICNIERSDPIEIRRHIRGQHVYKMLPQPIKPKLKETSTCNICGMVIKRTSFRTHLKTHTDSQKYPCSFCGKIFRKKYSKTTHERMHTGEKPFQCHQCGKRFFSNSLLGAHKQSHDKTTYPCKICGRVFNIPSGYRRHIQIHRKDVSFECTICFKSFTTRGYLTKHMHKHKEKTFQCSICENKFNTANGLRQHEIRKHNFYEPSYVPLIN